MTELDRQVQAYKRRADRGEAVSQSDAIWLLNELIYERDHGPARAPRAQEDGWVVEGFSIGIPSGYHYRISKTDDPLSFQKVDLRETRRPDGEGQHATGHVAGESVDGAPTSGVGPSKYEPQQGCVHARSTEKDESQTVKPAAGSEPAESHHPHSEVGGPSRTPGLDRADMDGLFPPPCPDCHVIMRRTGTKYVCMCDHRWEMDADDDDPLRTPGRDPRD